MRWEIWCVYDFSTPLKIDRSHRHHRHQRHINIRTLCIREAGLQAMCAHPSELAIAIVLLRTVAPPLSSYVYVGVWVCLCRHSGNAMLAITSCGCALAVRCWSYRMLAFVRHDRVWLCACEWIFHGNWFGSPLKALQKRRIRQGGRVNATTLQRLSFRVCGWRVVWGAAVLIF